MYLHGDMIQKGLEQKLSANMLAHTHTQINLSFAAVLHNCPRWCAGLAWQRLHCCHWTWDCHHPESCPSEEGCSPAQQWLGHSAPACVHWCEQGRQQAKIITTAVSALAMEQPGKGATCVRLAGSLWWTFIWMSSMKHTTML